MTDITAEVFERNRSRLTAIAYGMLGSHADAEDVVQDAWLRWMRTDGREVRSPEALLTTITTRIAIDQLRSARRRREVYPGPWLPEPIESDAPADPAELVVSAASMSLAFLSALERLSPVERAVLLLREVFDLDYAEIADIVDKSPANCRQIARRGRDKAGDRRFPSGPEPTGEATRIVSRYIDAVGRGDVDAVAALFTEDVVLWSDGGGKARAARHPIFGAWRAARHLVGVSRSVLALGMVARATTINGDPGLVIVGDDRVAVVIAFEVDDGRATGVRAILNPDKLEHVSPS